MNFFIRSWPMAIVFLMWMIDSAIHTPVPAVNEPQYLGKARFIWDSSWAEGDFFLESSNPHWGFYAAIGWFTRLMPLDAAAWCARGLGYALLAFGWTRLVRTTLGRTVLAIPAAGLFLLCASLGNLSGEWLVGGIEGKVFSYACLFASIADWLERRSNRALAWLGAAVTFHPVIGAWGLVCGAAVEFARRFRREPLWPSQWRDIGPPVGWFLLCAAPGLIPALMALGGGTSEESARATFMQVFIRLRHHLDPTTFSSTAWLCYAVMVSVAAVGWWKARQQPNPAVLHRRRDWLATFVCGTIVIALVGAMIGWHTGPAWTMPLRDFRGFLLKFYPFRLADVFVPLAFAFVVAHWAGTRRHPQREVLLGRAVATAILTLGIALALPQVDRNPSRMSPQRLSQWIAVAEWIEQNTPQGSIIVTPVQHWGFRWYAQRAEYVNYKDAPQDTQNLIEWERRLAVVRGWWESSSTGLFSRHDLERLRAETGAAYLVTLASARRFSEQPVYDNGSYRVYQLPE